VSWDDLERGGSCNECGEPVEQDHHAYCRDCYAEQQGWKHKERPPAGAANENLVVAIRDLRRVVAELGQRIDRLEQRNAA
jgi:hypothetical protein